MHSRLRTVFGTPSEFFASLEKALQQALTPSQAPESQHGNDDLFESHQRCWLLLEFVDALERNIHAAAHGSVERSLPGQSAMSFLTANHKVMLLNH